MSDPKILIVDDDRVIREVVAGVLESLGHQDYDKTNDGREALAKLEENKYDLIICDWVMPNLSGLALLNVVRTGRRHRKTPFIMVTAEATEKDITEAVRAGATDFVKKPFCTDDLAQRIAKVLG